MLAIIIALAGACTVMVVSIRAHRDLLRENRQLRKKLVELEFDRLTNR